jgi:cellulose synthase/poly-beta-1,6-N-acetylglucosamine synthase-like glycosyltransferase
MVGRVVVDHIAIAVPARNEEQFISRHLARLEQAAERTDARVSILIFANNCFDRTVELVRSRRGQAEVRVVEADLPVGRATAGWARRLAAENAVRLFPTAKSILTTDADSELRPESLEAIRSHFRAGSDVVCGAISTNLPDAVAKASSIVRHDRLAEPYGALICELRFAIDRLYGRQPEGPAPHYIESGACIALTRDLYDRIGGLPSVAVGEDRALVRLAEQVGASVTYCDIAHAVVSARLEGRAPGGMAETIRLRLADPDPLADSTMVSADDLKCHWQDAVARVIAGKRPPMPVASSLLRTSDLERELPRLAAFIEETVRPIATATFPTSQLVA